MYSSWLRSENIQSNASRCVFKKRPSSEAISLSFTEKESDQQKIYRDLSFFTKKQQESPAWESHDETQPYMQSIYSAIFLRAQVMDIFGEPSVCENCKKRCTGWESEKRTWKSLQLINQCPCRSHFLLFHPFRLAVCNSCDKENLVSRWQLLWMNYLQQKSSSSLMLCGLSPMQ